MEEVNVYRTISGDTWDLISYKVYGNEKYFSKLIKANIELVDIVIFDSNIPIIIPDLDVNFDKALNDKLPPWKRG